MTEDKIEEAFKEDNPTWNFVLIFGIMVIGILLLFLSTTANSELSRLLSESVGSALIISGPLAFVWVQYYNWQDKRSENQRKKILEKQKELEKEIKKIKKRIE